MSLQSSSLSAAVLVMPLLAACAEAPGDEPAHAAPPAQLAASMRAIKSSRAYADLDASEREQFDLLAAARSRAIGIEPGAAPSEDVIDQVSTAAATHRRYFTDVRMKPIFRKTVVLPAATSGPHVFYTLDLVTPSGSTGADPVIVVKHGWHTWHNDNCPVVPGAQGKNACVETSAEAGSYTITVFAASPTAHGTVDVYRDSTQIGDRVAFGGTLIPLSISNSKPVALQTVHTPWGATDTQAVLFGPGFFEKGYNDDGGIGLAAKIVSALAPGDQLLVGAYSSSSMGLSERANVIVNDCTGEQYDCAAIVNGIPGANDQDGDWLSDELEGEIGTNLHFSDTDLDGLFDYYEVIGHKDGAAELDLVTIGVNPRHADILLELDRDSEVPAPMTETNLVRVRDSYRDLPNFTNPDGRRGIEIHADRGAACPGMPTLCGNWGGSEQFAIDDHLYHTKKGSISAHFVPIRRGLFHYVAVIANCGVGNAGINQSTIRVCQDTGRPNEDPYLAQTLAHELGHNLGLNHSGDAEDPESSRMNNKVTYPSLMNYNYQDRVPGVTTGGRSRFSQGLLEPIDYHSLTESSYSPGQNKQHLAHWPTSWDVVGDTVDFNEDGRIDDGVLFDVGPKDIARTGTWPDMLGMKVAGNAVPTAGGALAVQPISGDGAISRVLAVAPFAHPDGIYPSIAEMIETVGGGTESFGAWQPSAPLPGVGFLPAGEPAAAFMNLDTFGPSVVVVMPGNDGHLWFNIYEIGENRWFQWLFIGNWLPGVSARNATAAVVDGKLVVLFRDLNAAEGAANVWMATMDTHNQWTSWQLLNAPSYLTPGIAQAPDGNAYLLTAEDTDGSADLSLQLRMWRRPLGSTGNFTLLGQPSFSDPGFGRAEIAPMTRTRLSLLFLRYRVVGGSPLPDGSGYLAAYWNVGRSMAAGADQRDWLVKRAYTTGFIAPSGASFGVKPAGWRAQEMTLRPFFGDSVAVANRQWDAVAFYNESVWQATDVRKPPIYQPYASGTPLAPFSGWHTDADDAPVLKQHLCSSIRDFTGNFCTCTGPTMCNN